jgi:ribosome biogenesis GTPase
VPNIPPAPGLLALGWDEGWMSALAELGDPTLVPSRVSRVDRGACTVMTATAGIRAGYARGLELAVGDWVATAPAEDRVDIVAVLARRCTLRREANATRTAPRIVAANVDTVLVCDALDGSLSVRHLERFLALVWQSGAIPVVLITKSDSVAPEVLAAAVEAVEAVAAGVTVLAVSSTRADGLARLTPYLVPGRTVALVGLSGAGKSTLANLLAGAEILATGAVRRDGKGRHTTTHRELLVLPGGGILIDTPGIRTLPVANAAAGVERAFHDFEALARACRYTSCSHGTERGCALTAAMSDGRLERGRLDSWLRLRAEPAPFQLDVARRSVEERKQRKAAKVAGRRAART